MERIIDANEIVKVAEHAYKEWNLAMAGAENNRQVNRCYKMQELCKAVSAVAQSVPILTGVERPVYCSDCRYWKEDNSWTSPIMYCSRNIGEPDDPRDFETGAMDYCSMGLRKKVE